MVGIHLPCCDPNLAVSVSSGSPSAALEAVPVVEYREWPFPGFFKRIRIGNDVTYNPEFKLPSISEQLNFKLIRLYIITFHIYFNFFI
jgi:hypothetical protein